MPGQHLSLDFRIAPHTYVYIYIYIYVFEYDILDWTVSAYASKSCIRPVLCRARRRQMFHYFVTLGSLYHVAFVLHIASCRFALYCAGLHCILSHCIVLHCIALHCVAFLGSWHSHCAVRRIVFAPFVLSCRIGIRMALLHVLLHCVARSVLRNITLPPPHTHRKELTFLAFQDLHFSFLTYKWTNAAKALIKSAWSCYAQGGLRRAQLNN